MAKPIPCDNDIWLFLLCTVRYSMGRQTYMVSESGNLVSKYNEYCTDQQLWQIADEITKELNRYEGMNKFLGAEFDHAEWYSIRDRILELLEKRKQKECS